MYVPKNIFHQNDTETILIMNILSRILTAVFTAVK